jgi:hypothetical protein
MGTKHSQLRTTKHEVIKAWAEAHGGVPARVRTTTDAIRVKIGDDEKQYEPIAWDAWFEVFDAKELAFVYEQPGYGCKIVPRNGHEDAAAAEAPKA